MTRQADSLAACQRYWARLYRHEIIAPRLSSMVPRFLKFVGDGSTSGRKNLVIRSIRRQCKNFKPSKPKTQPPTSSFKTSLPTQCADSFPVLTSADFKLSPCFLRAMFTVVRSISRTSKVHGCFGSAYNIIYKGPKKAESPCIAPSQKLQVRQKRATMNPPACGCVFCLTGEAHLFLRPAAVGATSIFSVIPCRATQRSIHALRTGGYLPLLHS